MARRKFGKDAAAVLFQIDGSGNFKKNGGAVATVWDSESGGTQLTDLLDFFDAPIPGGNVTGDSNGIIAFKGPDTTPETVAVWIDFGLGVRQQLQAMDTATLAAASVPLTAYGQQQIETRRAAALMGWHATLANRHYARANVVCIGDSITEGQGATSFANTWPARLRNLLRSRFPTPGVTGGRGFIGALSTGSSSYAWPAAVTGGPASNDDWGPKRLIPQLDAAAPADKITYSALQGTAVDIMWVRLPLGGNFRWRVDGGSWTTVATGGAQQDGMLTRVSLGSSGAHSLEIEANSGGFQAFVDGIIEYDGDENAGITVHETAHFGWDTSFWISTVTDPSGWPSAIGALNPGLILIMLGANDHFVNTPPATFKSNMQTLIAALRAANVKPDPFPPICLVMHGARGGSFTYTWPLYVAAAHEIAAADSAVVVCDLTLGPRFPDHAATQTHGLYADSAHLSNKGNSFVADTLAAFLAPR